MSLVLGNLGKIFEDVVALIGARTDLMLEAPRECLEPGLSSCVGEGTRALNKATC